jgi:hypothetical protein
MEGSRLKTDLSLGAVRRRPSSERATSEPVSSEEAKSHTGSPPRSANLQDLDRLVLNGGMVPRRSAPHFVWSETGPDCCG